MFSAGEPYIATNHFFLSRLYHHKPFWTIIKHRRCTWHIPNELCTMLNTLDLSDVNEENEKLYKKREIPKIVQMVERIEVDQSSVWINTVSTFSTENPCCWPDRLLPVCMECIFSLWLMQIDLLVLGVLFIVIVAVAVAAGIYICICIAWDCFLSSMIMWRKALTVFMCLSFCARKIYSWFFSGGSYIFSTMINVVV